MHRPTSLDDAAAARSLTSGIALRTPLVRLGVDDAGAEIFLKLENLQPIGSFKIRGAAAALGRADPEKVQRGVWTASAGNMAQGVAWCARRLGAPCTVVVPDTAPESKLAAIRRLGAAIRTVTFDEWLEVFRTRRHDDLDGVFVHPFSDPAVMAGNAVIGLEIVEDLPGVDAVVVPYGGGGLTCGIASVVRKLAPTAAVFACEVSSAAPLSASLAAGRPVEAEYTPSFVDGIGAPVVFEEMFELVRGLVDGALVSSLDEIAGAIRTMAERNSVVAEGAGAAPVAAALGGRAGRGKIVCVVSGGNIDPAKLAGILAGETPTATGVSGQRQRC